MGNIISRQEWATRIAAAWQSSLTGILDAGRLLIEAKEELDHGEFIAMAEAELPFGRITAFRLMAVAGDHRLSNVTHVEHCRPIGARSTS
jgi:hypothetical protein